MHTPTLGASLALTGPEAPYAQQLLVALELAIADEGGGTVRLCVEDDESDACAAAKAAARLVGSDAVVVIGPMNSWTCEVQGPIFASAGLPHVTPSASNPALARRGWSTFFRACPGDEQQARVLAEVAGTLVGARRVATVHDGTSFAEPLARTFNARCAELGLEVSATALVRAADNDPRALHAVVTAGADAVLVAGLEADCLFAATTLRGLGCRATLLGTDAVKPSHVLRATGFPAPYLTNSAADARHRAPEFHRRFEASHGRHHSVYTVETYDVTRHLVRWLAANPNATRAEASSMLRTPFDGLAGPYTFGPNGDRTDGEVGVYRDESSGLRYLGTASDIGALVGRSAGT